MKGEALKLRIDAGEYLSRKENVLVAERASIIALIDNAKKKRASELIAQRKESSAKKKAEIAADPEALAALAASAEASGQEQLAARGKTAAKPVVSPQLLKKLVIQGIVPEGREMLEGGDAINQFKAAEREQLNAFMLEMSKADRLSVKELVAFFDNEGNLSPIIDALGQKTKQESISSAIVTAASNGNNVFLAQIQSGFKLRKALGPVQKKPDVDAPAISPKEALKQTLVARMRSAKGSTNTQLTHQGKEEFWLKE